MRSSQENSTSHVTGDGIIRIVDYLLARRKELSRNEFLRVVDTFVAMEQGRPAKWKLRQRSKRILQTLLNIAEENKFTI